MTPLSDVIDDVYDAFENGRALDYDSISQGKLFVHDLMQDLGALDKIVQEFGLREDKRGWLKDGLFPITIEVLNRDPEAPGDEFYVGGGLKRVLVIYFGLSPELENFTSVILWPDSKSSKQAFSKIYDLVTGDPKKRRVVRFSEGYRVKLPNEIHPAYDRHIDSVEKIREAYDWKSVPYIKETGDTILSHKSPVNYRKILMNRGTQSIYINPKSTIGKITKVQGNQLEVIVPSVAENPRLFYPTCSQEMIEYIKKEQLIGVTCHLLIYEKAEENVTREVVIVERAEYADLVFSLLAYILYVRHVETGRLELVPYGKCLGLLNRCSKICYSFFPRFETGFRGPFSMTQLLEIHLAPFFRKIGTSVFYVPYYLYSSPNETLKLFDSALSRNSSKLVESGLLFDSAGRMLDRSLLERQYHNLRFMLKMRKFVWWNPKYTFVHRRLMGPANYSHPR